ncbi:MAG TPA: hypothetical protein VKR06_46440 [Ktedonosporobacter sp.]|nr:hypothetical protein [Ktedonosporobacter sp.]
MSKKDQEFVRQAMELGSQIEAFPWRIQCLRHMIKIGMDPMQALELRVSSEKDRPIIEQVQDAASMFFTAFSLYPTSIAVHSAIAALIEASEVIIKAKHKHADAHPMLHQQFLGKGFEPWPLRIEIDNNLDLRTTAVRYKISLDDEAYQEAFTTLLMQGLTALAEEGKG